MPHPPEKIIYRSPLPGKKDILDSRIYTRTLYIVLLDGLISIIACRVTITYITCTVVYSIIKGQITLTARKENLEHCKNCLKTVLPLSYIHFNSKCWIAFVFYTVLDHKKEVDVERYLTFSCVSFGFFSSLYQCLLSYHFW